MRNAGLPVAGGDDITVTGVVGSISDEYKIQPRDDDIEPATGVSGEGFPSVLSLSQNPPSPFGGNTGITYALPADSDVRLQVFNVAGRLVRTLVNGRQPAGTWSVVWDGKDEDSRPVSNGVCFYRLKTGGKTIEKRMVLIDQGGRPGGSGSEAAAIGCGLII